MVLSKKQKGIGDTCMLKKNLNFFKLVFAFFIFLSIFPISSHAEHEEAFPSLHVAGLASSNEHVQNQWLAHTLNQFSDSVRHRTSELVLYVEKVAALPGYLNQLIETHKDTPTLEKIGLVCFQILISLLLAFLLEFIFSVVQKRIQQKFSSLPQFWFEMSKIFLAPSVFFITAFFMFSFLIESSFLRSIFMQSIAFITALRILLRGLNYLDTVNPSGQVLSLIISPLRSLVYWSWSTIVLKAVFNALKVPPLLSGIIFGILGFVIFSLFTNCVLRLRPILNEWIKNHHFSYRIPLKSSFFQVLSEQWHCLLIVAGFLLYLSWAFKEDAQHFFIRIFSSLLILVGIQLISVLWHFLFKLWTDTDSILNRFDPIYADHISKSLRLVGGLLYVILYLMSFVLIGKIWGCDLIAWVDSTFKTKSLNIVIDISLTLILGVLTWQLTEALFQHYIQTIAQRLKGSQKERSAQAQRLRTILPVFQNGLRWVLSMILLLMILAQAGIDITPLLTGLGIFGLALSFGSQSLVKDFINGLNVLLDGSLNIGDYVIIGSNEGAVENLTLRNVELRDTKTGAVHIIPFSQVESISNFSKEYTYCSFEIEVSGDTDINIVSEIVNEVLKQMQENPKTKNMVLGEASIWGLKRMDGLTIAIDGRFKAGVYLDAIVRSEFNQRLQKALREKKISLSSPSEIIYLSSLKDQQV